MRIWHLMAAVGVTAIVSALLAWEPWLGVVSLLTGAGSIGTILLVRFDRTISGLWSRAERRCQQSGRLHERFLLLVSALVVSIYMAITSLFLVFTGSLMIVIIISVVAGLIDKAR